MNASYPTVAQRAEHRCEYCHAPEAIFNFPFEVEHVIPVALGGTNEDVNLALACRACNLFKTDHLTGEDATTQSRVTLFHPRHDRWPEHFRVEADTGIISGLSPVGRATVSRLRMNLPMQLEARQQWMRLGLFP